MIRDGVAAALLVLAALLPWNIRFGIGISESSGWMFGLLVVVTLVALTALVRSHAGPARADGDASALNRLRLILSVPYIALVLGFLVWAVVESFSTGGTAEVPPGVGPGAWIGLAGALLAAQPVLSVTSAANCAETATRLCRIIGHSALALAVVAVLANIYWRTRFVVPDIGDADTGVQNLVVAVTAVLYGVVNLLPMILTARWITASNAAARLATTLLAVAACAAGVFVWVLPVGRELDAFHGIAQNTSTVGVGFEGYLAWAATAAIVGGGVVLAAASAGGADLWRAAARKCLLLIAVWCGGTALQRIADLMLSAVLDLPDPPYIGATLMSFDLAAALLAMWLYVNTSRRVAAPRLLLTLLYGVLFALTVCRVILGVALVPRVPPLNPAVITDVYGNTLNQQITSTFDVALCAVGLALLVIAFVTGAVVSAKPVRRQRAVVQAAKEDSADSVASTTAIAAPAEPEGSATARIFPSESESTPGTPDRVADVLAQSTQRFAAGTTYGTTNPSGPRNTDQ
ncbi:hypothetical protein [Mycobacterium sp. ACS4331]|uniref:DUF7937 domain-containing protein n=1 Tax=Mycobacterium sp. ACS4331 TaxID=1834121 RepID=UPI001E530B18|nr:hypothetical protein [Mycobacterium sp. ACS4331]